MYILEELSEYIFYIIISTVIIFIVPFFIIYPGIYFGRWKAPGPVFQFETKDGSKIDGMIIEPPNPEKAKYTILYFHGNSGNMGNTTKTLNNIANMGYYVLSIDYRGFGGSYGFPSESGIINDAESIYERILNEPKLKNTKKIIFGSSLGAAVAVSIANKYDNIDGIILENTFKNTKSTFISKFPKLNYVPEFILNTILYPNTWDTENKIKDIKLPILFMYDNTTTPNHTEQLFKNYKHKKILYNISQNIDYYEQINNFVESC